jgi:uncharacterized membrane protein YadS
MDESPLPPHSPNTPAQPSSIGWKNLTQSEDWWAVWIGAILLALCLAAVLISGSDGNYANPVKPWLSKPGTWAQNPLEAFYVPEHTNVVPGLVGVFLCGLIAFGIGTKAMGRPFISFARAFVFLFGLALLAYLLAGQELVKTYHLGYALWALVLGLLISNTTGIPEWVRPALRTEFYIKTGLVLLGAEVLFSRLLALGLPGICIAWVVTPIVLVSTFWFGQRILRIESPTLNMVISADLSVCGVSAAIATAAACKAKKEELTLTVGMSLTFTVIMMVVMPMVIQATGMSHVLGGAWMGGTIDATGAVAAAGSMLGEDALQVAATIKMIQNILIGVIAFCVAVYWVVRYESDPRDGPTNGVGRPRMAEIWYRFPKFILGFVAASILFSLIYAQHPNGPQIVNAIIQGSTKTLRGWFFCLAFVSIGLETNFRALGKYLKGGKPLVLYLVGQTLNLCLTLGMAWLMFEKVFPHAADVLKQ